MHACAEILRADYPGIVFSSVYKTAARDEENQDDFLNAVATFETEKSPEEIHETLKVIEEELGKDPPYKKGPRTIDLDILLYKDPDNGQPTTDNLVIPHPRMHERRFVLEPLCELSSEQKWQDALKKTEDQQCEVTDIRL